MFLSVELAICDIRKIFWGVVQTFLARINVISLQCECGPFIKGACALPTHFSNNKWCYTL